MGILQHGAAIPSSAGVYEIENSCKFEADNREYLRWTNFSSQASAARKKKFTFSVWVKRTELGGNQQVFISTSQNGYLTFEANNQLTWIQQYGGSQLVINTTRVFRDTSAWYHIMVVVDTAQSTEANRTKIYVNGVQETVFDAAAYPSQNAEASNLFEQHLIVGEWGGTSLGFCGYMAEYYFLSEIAASPTDLGEFDEDSGIWKPKEYDGTISSPSHFLEFKDGSDLGTATAGLDSDYQNNLTVLDQATDTPTNNFCVMNFVDRYINYPTNITEGGSKVTDASSGYGGAAGTFGVTTGKWYYEARSSVSTSFLGWRAAEHETRVNNNAHEATGVVAVYLLGEYLYIFDASGQRNDTSSVVAAHDSDHVYGIALDLDNDTIKVAKNNTYNSQGAINIDGLADQKPLLPLIVTPGVVDVNFGGVCSHRSISSVATDANGYGKFEYAPPSGYLALCAQNLKENGG